jgi:MFS family permease
MLEPIKDRRFLVLWLGQSISILGDQFYLVALPLLVLQLTGSGLALGSIFIASTVPRIVFRLVGGAVTDRISPFTLIVLSNLFRLFFSALLTSLVLFNRIEIWHFFVFAALFGTIDAFFYTAYRSYIPSIISKEFLPSANALLQTTAMVSKALGPTLAGVVIYSTTPAVAFGVDTISFLIASASLIWLGGQAVRIKSAPAIRHTNLLKSIKEGLVYTWSNPFLKSLIIIITVVEFALAGPLSVGLAALANNRFGSDAFALGALLSAPAVGLLIGTVVAGSTQSNYNIRNFIILMSGVIALCLMLVGVVSGLIVPYLLIATIGVVGGYVQVHMASMLQSASDPSLRGRVISIFQLGSDGLTPISYAVTGLLVQYCIGLTYISMGLFLLTASFVCALIVHFERKTHIV